MTPPSGPRYAVYLAPPPGSDFSALGASWLGRDCWTGTDVARPRIDGLEAAAGPPNQYGFHGTLRAPFELREGRAAEDLKRTVADLASRSAPLNLYLAPKPLGPFLALQAEDQSTIEALQAEALPAIEPCRAPLSQYDRNRRMRAPLTDRQKELLDRWGYPYVADEFRFHMTLTGPQSADALGRFAAGAREHFAPVLAAPVMSLGLAVFFQSDRQAPFVALDFYPFEG